jgi:hypothetical protein
MLHPMSGSAQLNFTIDGDEDGSELQVLQDWLTADEDLRDAEIKVDPASVQTGHMGALSDALSVALPHAIAAGHLVLAIAAWWPTRRNKHAVKLTVNGVTVEVTNVEDLPKLLAQVQPLFDGAAGAQGQPAGPSSATA